MNIETQLLYEALETVDIIKKEGLNKFINLINENNPNYAKSFINRSRETLEWHEEYEKCALLRDSHNKI